MGRKRYAGIRARDKKIVIDFRYRGVRCREQMNLEPTPANMRFASNYRASIMHEIGKGVFNYAEHFPDSRRAVLFCGISGRSVTVGEAMREYLASKAKEIAPSTMRSYHSANNHYITPKWGNVSLNELTNTGIRAWIGTLECSNKRINNVLVPLRGMLKDAFLDALIERDPMAKVKNLPIDTPEPEPFTAAERDAILEVMHPHARLMFQFAFWTGLRTGELIAMRWDDVDMLNNIVRIRRSVSEGKSKRTKTKASMRDIELLAPAMEALHAMKSVTYLEGKQVWRNPKTGKPWTTDAQIRQTCWQHALKKAGVRYRCPYQTRHTFASTLLSNGANPMWVAQQMGHSDWGMIRKRYGRWIPQESSEAERMNQSLFGGEKSTKRHENEAFGHDMVTEVNA